MKFFLTLFHNFFGSEWGSGIGGLGTAWSSYGSGGNVGIKVAEISTVDDEGGGGGPTPSGWVPTKDPSDGHTDGGNIHPPDTVKTGLEDDSYYVRLKDENGFFYSNKIELQDFLAINQDKLVPCDQLNNLKSLTPFYQDLLNFQPDQFVANRLQNIINTNSDFNSNNLFLQTLPSGGSTAVNIDYFPLHVTTMPKINGQQLTPTQLLEYFRLHLTNIATNPLNNPSIQSSFEPYNFNGLNETNLWNQPTVNSVGAIMHLELPYNDGSVIISNYTNAQNSINTQWTFTTLHTPEDGYHPVSGNRRFGIFEDMQKGGYTFYIGGMDRISTSNFTFWDKLGEFANGKNGFQSADLLWKQIINNFRFFINLNYGNAEMYQYNLKQDFQIRPDYLLLQKYLRNEISFQQFKTAMGC